ncbi:MAG: 4Fe-4S binding protein, partial [Thermoplasmata archaeon]|nr:4Fe-4S binding protein [Thermoplasmata archaeon]
PTQVCMIIGQPFVGLFHKHNPENSRIISQEEGLQLLRDEHDRGHMHVAWFRTGMMDRFYAICNCCKCCCGGLEAMTKYDIPMLASSGYAAQVDEEKCVGCGKCIEPCPFDAITVKDGRATIDWEKCMGCGVCASQCPEEALSLVLDPKKGEPMDVREM